MQNMKQMLTEDFVQGINSLELFAEFTDYMAEIDPDYAEGESSVRSLFFDQADTMQQSYNRLCDYLNDYIGPRVAISEQEFSATVKRIHALRADMNAVSAIIDRWGMESYDIWGDLWEKVELRPLEGWVERIAEQVRAAKLEAA